MNQNGALNHQYQQQAYTHHHQSSMQSQPPMHQHHQQPNYINPGDAQNITIVGRIDATGQMIGHDTTTGRLVTISQPIPTQQPGYPMMTMPQPFAQQHQSNGCLIGAILTAIALVLLLLLLFVIPVDQMRQRLAEKLPGLASLISPDAMQQEWTVDGKPVGQSEQAVEQPDTESILVQQPEAGESEFLYQQAPTISLQTYADVLEEAGSPAASEAQEMYNALVEVGFDPAIQLAFAKKETSFGTAGVGRNKNLHGVKCNNWDNEFGASCASDGHSIYPSYTASVQAWTHLLSTQGYLNAGLTTPRDVLPRYCPFSDGCNPDIYANQVEEWVRGWRAREGQGNLKPHGNPLRSTNTVVTQGYNGTYSHSPTNIWGALDLALDGNGDGVADPAATQGQPVYATHVGVAHLTPDGQAVGGNHIWVENNQYKTGYAHLGGFTVRNGQWVEPGDQIGTVGSTGLSSGPHLDYQVWSQEGGQWVNQNPEQFGVLENK